jgi:hypothetical protein
MSKHVWQEYDLDLLSLKLDFDVSNTSCSQLVVGAWFVPQCCVKGVRGGVREEGKKGGRGGSEEGGREGGMEHRWVPASCEKF